MKFFEKLHNVFWKRIKTEDDFTKREMNNEPFFLPTNLWVNSKVDWVS